MVLTVGQRVPAITASFPDAEGRPRSLAAALADRRLVLGIYKSSCQASKTLFPILERLHRRQAGDGLTVLGVSQDSANITRSFARRTGVSFPMLVEGRDYPLSRAFEVEFTPTYYLIRPDGAVAFAAVGFLRDQVNELGAVVAAELGVAVPPLVAEDETEVPFFVPG